MLCTGCGIDQLLPYRNLGAVPDMTMPTNTLLGIVRIPRSLRRGVFASYYSLEGGILVNEIFFSENLEC